MRSYASLLPIVPLAVLVGFGLLALRQDRLLVEQDARERADELALTLAQRIDSDFAPTNLLSALLPPELCATFVTDDQGDLLDPIPVRPASTPAPFAWDELAPEAQSLWLAANTAEFQTRSPDDSVRAWRQVCDAPLPDRWAASATYNLALALARTGALPEAEAAWERLSGADPAQTTESGLPYATLARWQRFQMRLTHAPPPGVSVDQVRDVCSNLVRQPSPLTEPLLAHIALGKDRLAPEARAEADWWLTAWRLHDRARTLHAAARRQWQAAAPIAPTSAQDRQASTPPSAPLWVSLPGSNTATNEQSPPGDSTHWLVVCDHGIRRTCHGLAEPAVRQLLDRARANSPRYPAYLQPSFEIAGRVFFASPQRALATRAARPAAESASIPWVRVSVHLTDPATLFARQRLRSMWLGALLLAAAAVALAGLWAAHRAFRRQIRLNELKSNFVSAASHELRAPIASVRLLAESLERGRVRDPDRCQAYYRLIGQECRRLSGLIENVLDFSRIDQGRKRYEFEPTDVAALVDHTLQLMQPYAADRQVRLELATRPGTAALQPEIDGKAVQQALVNLIDNAVKHAPPNTSVLVALDRADPALQPSADPTAPPRPADTPTAQANANNIESPPARLLLSVADHGPGVPPEDLARIFEPFYRRGSELRRETPGIGIGLSIVKHIAAAHGGTVRVESTLGHGSRFVLELPMRQPQTQFPVRPLPHSLSVATY